MEYQGFPLEDRGLSTLGAPGGTIGVKPVMTLNIIMIPNIPIVWVPKIPFVGSGIQSFGLTHIAVIMWVAICMRQVGVIMAISSRKETGVMEWWSNGKNINNQYSNTPSLQGELFNGGVSFSSGGCQQSHVV